MYTLGFTGSRNLSASDTSHLNFVLRSAVASTRWSSYNVGCCPTGADLVVRSFSGFPHGSLSVLFAKSRLPHHLVARSAKLAWVSGCVVGFPGCPCPIGLVPCSVSSKCFAGFGSGTWATLAFAAGLGSVVYVGGVNPSLLPRSWGSWQRSSTLPGCWRLVPAVFQQRLF